MLATPPRAIYFRGPRTTRAPAEELRSEVARFEWRREPAVATPVHVGNTYLRQLPRLDGVEAGDIDGDEVSAQHLEIALLEGPHTTVLAEVVMHHAALFAVVRQLGSAGQQAESAWLDDGAPQAGLRAEGAVALTGALAE